MEDQCEKRRGKGGSGAIGEQSPFIRCINFFSLSLSSFLDQSDHFATETGISFFARILSHLEKSSSRYHKPVPSIHPSIHPAKSSPSVGLVLSPSPTTTSVGRNQNAIVGRLRKQKAEILAMFRGERVKESEGEDRRTGAGMLQKLVEVQRKVYRLHAR